MKNISKKVLIIILAFLLTIVGISQQIGTSTVKGEVKPTVSLGLNIYAVSAATWLYGKEKGWWDELDLNVEFQYFLAGVKHLYAMAAGDVKIGTNIGDTPPVLVAGTDPPLFNMKIIMAVDGNLPQAVVVTSKPDEIKSITDLKGKTVASMAGSNVELVFFLALQKYGLKPGDLKLVNMEYPDIYAALKAKKIDAGALIYTHGYELVQKYGCSIIFEGHKLLEPPNPIFHWMGDTMITNEDWAKNNVDIVLKAMAVHFRGVDHWLSNELKMNDWLIPVLSRYHGVEYTPDVMLVTYRLRFKPYTLKDVLTTTNNFTYEGNIRNCLKRSSEYFLSVGRIKKIPDWDYIVDNKYLNLFVKLKDETRKVIDDANNLMLESTRKGIDISKALKLIEKAEEYYEVYNYWKARPLAEEAIKILMAASPVVPSPIVTPTVTPTPTPSTPPTPSVVVVEKVPDYYWYIFIITVVIGAIVSFNIGRRFKKVVEH